VNVSIEGRRLLSPQEVNQNLGGTNSSEGFAEEAVSVNSFELFIPVF